jgi:hypothetical protein
MILTLVFSVWISTLSLQEQERESQEESMLEENSENIKESQLMKLNNGSLKRWLEPSFEILI